MKQLLAVGMSAAALASVLALEIFQDREDRGPADARPELEQIVHSDLLGHPEILEAMHDALGRRRTAAEIARRKSALALHEEALLESGSDIVLGNPDGDVTVVEFFDYNCAFCKRALAGKLELLSTHRDARLVLKDFPILGIESLQAAEVGVAVKMQVPNGDAYATFHSRLLGMEGRIDRTTALEVAATMGLDVDRIEQDAKSPEVRAILEENVRLAEALGIEGTPTYVVGDAIVPGAMGAGGFLDLVAAARRASD